MIGIYKITSPTNRVYIGQSVNIERRLNDYKNLNCKKQKRLFNSFKKHGFHVHIFEVIEECEIDKLNERERYWQDYYDVLNENGMNLCLTNSCDNTGYLSSYTKKKISKSMIGNKSRLGKKHSDETKMKISDGNKGKKLSKKHIDFIRKCKLGSKLTKEHKENISKSLKGTKFNITKELHEFKSKITSERFSKKVLDINTGLVYKSAKEYASSKNLNYNKVRNILAGHVKNIYNIKKYE